MQVVIDIEDSLYEWVHRQLDVDEGWSMVQDAIMSGTPLPKGHGRLIDENQIKKCGMNFVNHHIKTDAPTIIEADGEVKR